MEDTPVLLCLGHLLDLPCRTWRYGDIMATICCMAIHDGRLSWQSSTVRIILRGGDVCDGMKISMEMLNDAGTGHG